MKPITIALREAEDLPGTWVVMCLEMHIVSQGDNYDDAIRMIKEAVEMTVEGDREDGFDTFDRITEEEFKELCKEVEEEPWIIVPLLLTPEGKVI